MNVIGWSRGLEVTVGGEGVVSHAGLALLRMLADRTGLSSGLSKALAQPRVLVHDRGRVLADVAAAIADADPGRRWSGRLGAFNEEVSLETVGGVFCWRPTRPSWPAQMSDSERRFASAEARLGLGGLLASLPCRWVNHPSRTAEAEYKPLQCFYGSKARTSTGCCEIPALRATIDAAVAEHTSGPTTSG